MGLPALRFKTSSKSWVIVKKGHTVVKKPLICCVVLCGASRIRLDSFLLAQADIVALHGACFSSFLHRFAQVIDPTFCRCLGLIVEPGVPWGVLKNNIHPLLDVQRSVRRSGQTALPVEFVITIQPLPATIDICANPEGRAIQPLACTFGVQLRRIPPSLNPKREGKQRQISTLEGQCGPGGVQTKCLMVSRQDMQPKNSGSGFMLQPAFLEKMHQTTTLCEGPLFGFPLQTERACSASHAVSRAFLPSFASFSATRAAASGFETSNAPGLWKKNGLPRMDPLKESGKKPLDAEKDERTGKGGFQFGLKEPCWSP